MTSNRLQEMSRPIIVLFLLFCFVFLIHSVLALRLWLTRSQHFIVWHWIFERFWVHGVPDVFLALLTRSKISDQLIQPARGILSCTKKYRKNSGQQLLFYHKPAWSLCDQNRSRFDKKYRKTISGTKFTRALDAAWEKITSVHSDASCITKTILHDPAVCFYQEDSKPKIKTFGIKK